MVFTGEWAMADDKGNRGTPDRQRINTAEPYELRDWAKSLGVSEERLRTAVNEVGNSAEAVRRYLGGGSHASGDPPQGSRSRPPGGQSPGSR
jgi:hypothetical protein